MSVEAELRETWVWHYVSGPADATLAFTVVGIHEDQPRGQDPGGGLLRVQRAGSVMPSNGRPIVVVAPKHRPFSISLVQRDVDPANRIDSYAWTNLLSMRERPL